MPAYSQKFKGKEVGPASTYAEPHTMQGKNIANVEAGKKLPFNKKKNWEPMDGVSITSNDEVKTSGIKIRGTGAAIKGVMARGPMA
jgi:hypothetical protein